MFVLCQCLVKIDVYIVNLEARKGFVYDHLVNKSDTYGLLYKSMGSFICTIPQMGSYIPSSVGPPGRIDPMDYHTIRG